MATEDQDVLEYASRIVKRIVKKIGMKPHMPCICGSGKKYRKCCEQKTREQLFYSHTSFISTMKYVSATKVRNGTKSGIPMGEFNKFMRASEERFTCLCLQCGLLTADCHLVPESALRTLFGTHCLDYRLLDGSSVGSFEERGVHQTNTLKVFCKEHDKELFQIVDSLPLNISNPEALFKNAFKILSFSARQLQHLIGINFQIELFRPVLASKRILAEGLKRAQIDISQFHGQYLIYVRVLRLYKQAAKALDSNEWDFFTHAKLSVDTEVPLLFYGPVALPYDLKGQAIGSSVGEAIMFCQIIQSGAVMQVVLSFPGEYHADAYRGYVRQLKRSSKTVLLKELNKMMSISASWPILSIEHDFSEKDITAIDRVNEYLKKQSQTEMNHLGPEVFEEMRVDFLKQSYSKKHR